jgi:hypothetical protein
MNFRYNSESSKPTNICLVKLGDLATLLISLTNKERILIACKTTHHDEFSVQI